MPSQAARDSDLRARLGETRDGGSPPAAVHTTPPWPLPPASITVPPAPPRRHGPDHPRRTTTATDHIALSVSDHPRHDPKWPISPQPRCNGDLSAMSVFS